MHRSKNPNTPLESPSVALYAHILVWYHFTYSNIYTLIYAPYSSVEISIQKIFEICNALKWHEYQILKMLRNNPKLGLSRHYPSLSLTVFINNLRKYTNFDHYLTSDIWGNTYFRHLLKKYPDFLFHWEKCKDNENDAFW